jgi:hypothetical protein
LKKKKNSLLMGSHYQMLNSKPGRNVTHVFGLALNYPKASFVEITPNSYQRSCLNVVGARQKEHEFNAESVIRLKISSPCFEV